MSIWRPWLQASFLHDAGSAHGLLRHSAAAQASHPRLGAATPFLVFGLSLHAHPQVSQQAEQGVPAARQLSAELCFVTVRTSTTLK